MNSYLPAVQRLLQYYVVGNRLTADVARTSHQLFLTEQEIQLVKSTHKILRRQMHESVTYHVNPHLLLVFHESDPSVFLLQLHVMDLQKLRMKKITQRFIRSPSELFSPPSCLYQLHYVARWATVLILSKDHFYRSAQTLALMQKSGSGERNLARVQDEKRRRGNHRTHEAALARAL